MAVIGNVCAVRTFHAPLADTTRPFRWQVSNPETRNPSPKPEPREIKSRASGLLPLYTTFPGPVDQSAGPMAPMPRQWLHRLPSPQSTLCASLCSRTGHLEEPLVGVVKRPRWSRGGAWELLGRNLLSAAGCERPLELLELLQLLELLLLFEWAPPVPRMSPLSANG